MRTSREARSSLSALSVLCVPLTGGSRYLRRSRDFVCAAAFPSPAVLYAGVSMPSLGSLTAARQTIYELYVWMISFVILHNRENEVLKVQLKKYVCAVQMLKKEGQSDTIPNLRNIDGEINPEVKPVMDHDELASSYERKLIEVAEMHGELIEFNERLHRALLTKEALVSQMRQELIDLRGPVPGDLSQTSEDQSLSDFEISHRALINVWIPLVFLRSKSTRAFHVYQVYIRIKDDEWNIYKRYAEFRNLHYKLLSKYPYAKTIPFPPKKVIGNKDAKFVEERRKQLQIYLRNVMNKVIQTLPDFVAKPNKENLTQIMPFCA
ncbi:PREDICTED: sorting nexin-29-like [Nanorana parkeri]|uniref:sorting nexin-29-like n=1 Tax=Nanorana parkeri TaxID=125878 RepID=UPI0008545762|nr:PREDICTED: sorting nexin-29-like [Nanorana parkeri]